VEWNRVIDGLAEVALDAHFSSGVDSCSSHDLAEEIGTDRP
jgi:hypothetical protein